jgi:lysophospholipase L1-like esterase
MKIKFIYYIAILAFLASCKPDINEFTPSNGNADFTSYVAVGNSLTAGYADGALYKSGQKFGWANILATQFKAVGGNGQFNIPMMPTEDGVGVYGPVLVTKLILGYSDDCLGNTSMGPVRAISNPDQLKLLGDLVTSVASTGPFNNLGVPGIKVAHVFAPGLGMLNPYYGRMAENPSSDKIMDDVTKVNPTFFSCWLGNNDVLDFATSGGTSAITPLDGGVGVGFTATYTAAVSTIMASADKGVLANIPGVTSAAFFTTVPYNAIPMTDQTVIDFINAAYLPYNTAMEQMGQPYRINFKLGANAMVIYDETMPSPIPDALKFRQMTSDELVLLSIPQDSIKCAQWGSAKPIPTQYILTASEIEQIKTATTAFNSVIKGVADANGLAFVDVNSILVEAKTNGLTFNGITFTTDLVTGNLFSLDGIHLTPQGNAVVANYFIDAINSTYNSNIPHAVVSNFPAATFPSN